MDNVVAVVVDLHYFVVGVVPMSADNVELY